MKNRVMSRDFAPAPHCLALLLLVGLAAAERARASEGEAFTKTVAPILQARCVSCHNSIDRRGKFSLQQKSELFGSGYVEPGRPEDSALLDLLVSHQGKKPAMPKSGPPLTAAEVAVLTAWIKAGAHWPDDFRITEPVIDNTDWWSLRPLVQPAVPPSAATNPIDAFILRELSRRQLTPSPTAEPRVLVRRLYFDLIGLPPTPEEVDAFVAESLREQPGDKPSAYERLVDRLLASPRYGERWARHWLDVVKYADTCGYDKDKLRPNAWPYRDYVIRSFNEDKPYSRFVQEQLAGDKLYPGESAGILGLGFIAAGPWDFIGHVEVPETKTDGKIARHTDRDEMVSNTLNTFCSLTIQCCQCHNHKFDPFTQEHYYNLQAVFAAVDRAERPYDLDPQIEQKRREIEAQLSKDRAAAARLIAEIQKEGGTELALLEKQIAELNQASASTVKPPEFGYHSALAASPDREKWVQVDLGRELEIAKIVLRPCHDDFNNIGAGFGFPVRFRLTASLTDPSTAAATAADQPSATLLHDATGKDVPNSGLNPYEIPLRAKTRFIRLTATELAPRQNDFILALAELEVLDSAGNNLALQAPVSALDAIEAPVRWRKSNLTDGLWAKPVDPKSARLLADAQQRRQAILNRIRTPERIQEESRLAKAIAAAEAQRKSLPAGKLVYAAATHFVPQGSFQPTAGKPRPIHLLHRGNVGQPLSPSTPGTVPIFAAQRSANDAIDAAGRFLLPPDHSEADRRAALALWITRNDHPLTWRSIVNRIWQYHFGRGMVDTPNDFGRMGAQPSHPELLDWLAAEFRDQGQSFKKLHRLIVTSNTYRQASAHHEANAAADSENRLLWRMNRRRLEAEEIRDAQLAVSGKLNLRMGGPGYFLFVLEQPAHSPHYEYHKFNPADPASQRRSIYRFVVRSQPDPYLTTLDCADSSQSTPLRNETLTALQALSLLNNGFSLLMAREFATNIAAGEPNLEKQVDRAFIRAIGRTPTEHERAELTAYARTHGAANLCRLLFNLSEFIYID